MLREEDHTSNSCDVHISLNYATRQIIFPITWLGIKIKRVVLVTHVDSVALVQQTIYELFRLSNKKNGSKSSLNSKQIILNSVLLKLHGLTY